MGRAKKVKYNYYGVPPLKYSPFLYTYKSSTGYIVKLDYDGNVVDDEFASQLTPNARCLLVDISNNVYSATGANFYKYNSSGVLQWSKTQERTITDIAVDSTGACYVGYLISTGAKIITKYDSDGNTLFDIAISNNYNTGTFGLSVDYDDNIIFSYLQGGSGKSAKYDSSGNPVWTKDDPGGGPASNCVDSNNKIIITGGGAQGLYIIDSDASGTILDERAYTETSYGYNTHKVVDSDGNIYVLNSKSPYNGFRKYDRTTLGQSWANITYGLGYRQSAYATGDHLFAALSDRILKFDVNTGAILFNLTTYNSAVAAEPLPFGKYPIG